MRRSNITTVAMLLSAMTFSTAHAAETVVVNESQAVSQHGQACRGTVKDANGEPLVGVSVMVQGTSTGAVTDLSGNFNIANVKKGARLRVSYVGYLPREVVFNGQPLNLTLDEDHQSLQEVVVVGFGTQKKENLTGSVSQVKMEDVLGDRPVTTAAAALQGAMPGLTIGGGTGPGTSKSFNIRGTLSINGGSPLILIDNVEGDINMLNPEDIESVSVLKDAASAAIYGARAAGGVILVTTKHPQQKEKINVNYNFNIGWENSLNVMEQSSLLQYIDAYLEAGYTNTYWAGNGDVSKWRDYLQQYKANPSSLNTVGDGIFKDEDGRVYWLSEKNMYKNILTTGALQNHNVSVSGGTDRVRFRISGGLSRENGPLYSNKDMYYRKNIMGFVSADATKWLTQELTISYAEGKRTSPENVGNMSGFYTTRLIDYYPEGNIPGSILGTTDDYPSQTPRNMIELAPMSHTRTSIPRISTRTILKPLKGWTITAEYTHDRQDQNYDFYSGRFRFADVQLSTKYSTEAGQDYYTMQDYQRRYNAINIYSNYDHTWGDHGFKAMVGFNQESSSEKTFYGRILGQAVPSVPSFGGGTGEKTISDSYSEYSIRGVFGRLNYSFKDRYLVEFNGRYDGSSKFPHSDRFGFFPSVSAGWRLGQESFMKWSRSWLDDFKIRASYGSIGNQRISPYQFYPSMSVGQSSVWLNGGSYVTVISSPGLVSSSFTWEKVKTFDVGFDASLLNSRLQVTFDWYDRRTNGMLAAGMEIPAVVGASAPLQNTANLSTKGWELNLSWRDRIGDFSYGVSFNIYDSKTTIKKFNNEQKLLGNYYEGQRLGQIWGYVSDGYYTIDDFDLEAAKGGVWTLKDGVTSIQGYKPQPGDEKFLDLDGDGIITTGANTANDPGDRKIIGNNSNRYQFGGNVYGSWKGISLDVRFQGVGKRDYWLSGAAIFPFAGQGAGDAVFQPLFYNQTDYWTAKSYDPTSPDYMVAANPNAKVFRIYDQGNNVGSNTRVSTKYLQDASYLRIKNITLGYNLPQEWTKQVYISNARIFFSVENPFTVSDLPKGYDPEGNSSNSISWSYPYYRTFSFGANITF